MKLVALLFLVVAILFSNCSGNASQKSEAEKEKSVSKESVVKEDYVEYHDNNQVKIKGQLVNGKREGTWTSYYKNGLKWSETKYVNDVAEGETTSWYEDGIMRYVGKYSAGKRTGIWIFYDEEGKIVKRVDLTESGS